MAKAAPSVTRASSLSDRSDSSGDVSSLGVENRLRAEDSAFSSIVFLFAVLFGCLSALSRLNPGVPIATTCATLPAQGQLIGERGGKLARRRFQKGSVFLRGKKNQVWVGRWREDVIEDGRIRREYRSEVLGSKSDYWRCENWKSGSRWSTIFAIVPDLPQRLRGSHHVGSRWC